MCLIFRYVEDFLCDFFCNIFWGGAKKYYFATFCEKMDIINEVIMREMFDAEWVYESPEVLVIELKSEGVLCFSNEIPDWEENEDIL